MASPEGNLKLNNVISRLEAFTREKPTRNKKIQNWISQFQKDPGRATEIFKDNYDSFNQRPAKKADFQDVAAAYFFHLNRLSIPESYDEIKEERQIEAVLALLDGLHIHVGTGEGKSSVIFPIATIVESLTSEKKAAVLSTADDALLSELKSHTKKYLDKIPLKITEVSIPPEEQGGYIDKPLEEKMIAESLTTGSFSQETKDKIRVNYWWKKLINPDKERSEFLDRFSETVPKIAFLTERDLVFTAASDKENFQKKVPTIFLDEADVPYNRKTPYETVQKHEYHSPDEIIASTRDWLVSYVIDREITTLQESKMPVFTFQEKTGGHELTTQAKDALFQVDLTKIFTGKSQYTAPLQYFTDGVEIIAKRFGFNEKQKNSFFVNMSTYFCERLPKNRLPPKPDQSLVQYERVRLQQQMIEEIAQRFSQLYQEEGVIYTLSPEGKPQVRDKYTDQILESHEFGYEQHLAILAHHGRFEFVPQESKSYQTSRFQSFIAVAADRIRCGSGTLLFPDPETGEIRSSPFSRFLEWVTGEKIALITPSEVKKAPDPYLLENDEDSINALVGDISSDQKPTLIVSYNTLQAKKIYERLKRKFLRAGVSEEKLNEQVRYVETKPSDPKKVAEYEASTKQDYRDLAEGRVRIIVSSGAAGFGVNIMKSDGKAPDLRVILHNLPENRLQLMQVLGRRRAEGDDFAWYISQTALERNISLFDSEVGRLEHWLGRVDEREIRERLDKAFRKNDRHEYLKIVLTLLEKAETAVASHDEYVIKFDQTMEQVRKRAFRYLKERAVKDHLKDIDWFLTEAGLPESLDRDIEALSPFIPNAANLDDRLLKIFDTFEHDFIPNRLSQWYRERKKILGEFRNVLFDEGKIAEVLVARDISLYDKNYETNFDRFGLKKGLFREKFTLPGKKPGQIFQLGYIAVKGKERFFALKKGGQIFIPLEFSGHGVRLISFEEVEAGISLTGFAEPGGNSPYLIFTKES